MFYPPAGAKHLFFRLQLMNYNPWTYKTKDVNGEKIIGSSSEKELLFSKL